MELPIIDSTDDCICLRHVTDAFLKEKLSALSEVNNCMACGAIGQPEMVNMEHLAEAVHGQLTSNYNHIGEWIDGEQLLTPLSTEEVSMEVLDNAIEEEVLDFVVPLISELINEEPDWFAPIDGDVGIVFEWEDFERSVMHETRLLSPFETEHPRTAPERNYEFVRSMLVLTKPEHGLVTKIPVGKALYRARTARDARELARTVREDPAQHLGPAPKEVAAAGRMNSQGVPMLYVAIEQETACAEVSSHSPYDSAVVGAFEVQQPLHVLDLTRTPLPRSRFDESFNEDDQRLQSVGYYVSRITRPVFMDGNHPVDYAASQILTEAFRWWSEPGLDGIAYPSKLTGGTNIVLFLGDLTWIENEGQEPPNVFVKQDREDGRGNVDPLLVIRRESVEVFNVKRELQVSRSPF